MKNEPILELDGFSLSSSETQAVIEGLARFLNEAIFAHSTLVEKDGRVEMLAPSPLSRFIWE